MLASTVVATTNYFRLFGLTKSFDIDLDLLKERYRKLQHAVHPDKFANSTDSERRISVQQSSFVNQAYQTLLQPLARAKYLLELSGIDLSADTDTSMAPDFLMQQMELRELLEAVDSSQDPFAELIKIGETIDSKITSLLTKIAQAFRDAQSTDISQARDLVRRLQFLSKLQTEILEKEERLL